MQRNIKRTGYISELKSLISELEQYHITADDLAQMEEFSGMPAAFVSKAHDVRVLYEGFLQFLSDKYVTAEKLLELFLDVAGDSALIKESVLLFDGYTGFTPIQTEVLRQLFPLVEKVYVSVTIAPDEAIWEAGNEQELFAMWMSGSSDTIPTRGTCMVLAMWLTAGTQLDPE